MAELEDVLRRIRKCLALSKSSNEHEAAAALRQAQKLMAAYNVTQEAIDGAEVGVFPAKATAWIQVPQWEIDLANTIRKAFGCHIMLTKGFTGVLATVDYIGLKQNAELAAYAHEVLQRQIVRGRAACVAEAAEKHQWFGRGEKMATGESYCRGFVLAVYDKVHALANAPELEAAIEKRTSDLLGPEAKVHAPPKRGHSGEAFEQGLESGSKASLHRPMGGADEQLKLTLLR